MTKPEVDAPTRITELEAHVAECEDRFRLQDAAISELENNIHKAWTERDALKAWRETIEPLAQRVANADSRGCAASCHGDASDIERASQELANAACALRKALEKIADAAKGAT
jgi:uncharacterized coiled-coil protein SlyX